jgi:hypothetical protein
VQIRGLVGEHGDGLVVVAVRGGPADVESSAQHSEILLTATGVAVA